MDNKKEDKNKNVTSAKGEPSKTVDTANTDKGMKDSAKVTNKGKEEAVKASQPKPECFLCYDKGKSMESTGYCVVCEIQLCAGCYFDHRSDPDTRDHVLI